MTTITDHLRAETLALIENDGTWMSAERPGEAVVLVCVSEGVDAEQYALAHLAYDANGTIREVNVTEAGPADDGPGAFDRARGDTPRSFYSLCTYTQPCGDCDRCRA